MEKEKQPVLLSIYPGTATGWAISNEWGGIKSGVSYFRPRENEPEEDRVQRFTKWFNGIRMATGNVGTVFSEEYPEPSEEEMREDSTARNNKVLRDRLSRLCERFTIPCEKVPGKEMRKYISGDEDPDGYICLSIMKTLGHKCEELEEATALALLYFARKKMGVS